jgi:chemotaxis protein CheD
MATSVSAPATSSLGGDNARLQRLKSQPRGPGEASFFFYDAHFKCEAVRVLPGEYFVHNEDMLIVTTLGSCIAACLWDRDARVGGMNHFMLPEGAGESGRYGSFAMEMLINQMMKRGASRLSLEAKVFGGGQIIAGANGAVSTLNVGERNTTFVLDYLKAERIAVVSRDVLGPHPRKVCFLPASGKAMVKRLGNMNTDSIVAQERSAARQATPQAASAGTVDLF